MLRVPCILPYFLQWFWLPQSVLCAIALCVIESLRLKRQIRSSGPTTNPSSPCPLTRVTQCHECPYKAPALSLTPNRNPCRVAISEPPAPNGVDVHSLSPPQQSPSPSMNSSQPSGAYIWDHGWLKEHFLLSKVFLGRRMRGLIKETKSELWRSRGFRTWEFYQIKHFYYSEQHKNEEKAKEIKLMKSWVT